MLLDQQNAELVKLKTQYDAVREQNILLGQQLKQQG